MALEKKMTELTAIEEDAVTQFEGLLIELKINSKPMINVLTMMAEDFLRQAPIVVRTIEGHLNSVQPSLKLPVLYLIDSIVKNVGQEYPNLFTQNIVSTFCGVFEKVDDKVKLQMFKLRQTWSDHFPQRKLYAIDVRCHQFDKNWPISAPPPSNTSSIHVNPKFLNTTSTPAMKTLPPKVSPIVAGVVDTASLLDIGPVPEDVDEVHLRETLLQKRKELLELQQKKIELELMQTKSALESKRLEEIQSTVQQEKLLLGQAEKAKSKTYIAHQLLSNAAANIVKTGAHSSTPPQPVQAQVALQSLVPAPPVKMEKNKWETDKDSFKDRTKDKERENHRGERDRSGSRGKRTSSTSSKDSKDHKVRRNHNKDDHDNKRSTSKSSSKSPTRPIAIVKEEVIEHNSSSSSPRHHRSPKSHHKKSNSGSSGLEDLLPISRKGEESEEKSPRRKHNRSSSKESKASKTTRGGDDHNRDGGEDKRSSTSKHHTKKSAVIKAQEHENNFRARRSAVLKRNYRKTQGIDMDEDENKIPLQQQQQQQQMQISSAEDASSNNTNTIDVDLRFQGRRGVDADMQQDDSPNNNCQNNESLPKKPRLAGNGNVIVESLFGREDVDLRQTPCGNWMGPGGGPRPAQWGPDHPRMMMRGGGDQQQWGPPPPLLRPGPRGPNPFEEALDFPRQPPIEREMRPADRDGPWLPNHPRMNQHIGDQWGLAPPQRGPVGPNPFEAALDQGQFIPNPNEMELRIMNERPGHFNKAQRRGGRGQRGGRGRGGGGRGNFMDQHNMMGDQQHQLMEMRNFPFGINNNLGNNPTPMFPPHGHDQQQRMVRDPFNPFIHESPNNDNGEQQRAPLNENDPPASGILDVSSLLQQAISLGLLPATSSEPATKEADAETKTEVVEEAKVVLNDPPKESAISKYQKYQKFQRNNHKKMMAPVQAKPPPPPLPTVDVLLVSEEKNYFKDRRQGLINQLWVGKQCATCGLRFPPDQNAKYEQHLDWHFRRNARSRKEKEDTGAKKPQRRAWYYKLPEWILFEEIEDIEERAASMFETQGEADAKTQSPGGVVSPEECSVPASSHTGSACPQCGENFESYYDQDKEEWRLRSAVVDSTEGEDKVYHYICHQDYINSSMMTEEAMQVVDEISSVTVDDLQNGTEEVTEQASQQDSSPPPQEASPIPPQPEDDDDDEVLILKEGKKEVLVEVMDIDDVDDEGEGEKEDESNDNEKNKEIEIGPETSQEINTTATESTSDDVLSNADRLPVLNYSIISRPISSPIVVNDDSSSNLLPGISEDSSGGVFGFALNLGNIRERSESPEQVDEKRIVYKSMEFDFPKIKIEPPDDYDDVPDDVASTPNPTAMTTPVVELSSDQDPIDLTGEDDSVDACDGPPPRSLHQMTSIDGNLHQEVYVPIIVPPTKMRINISGLDISAKSPSSKDPKPEDPGAVSPTPEKGSTSPKSPTTTVVPRSPEPSDSSNKCSNAEIMSPEEMKYLKPRLHEFLESGRKFKNCPPKQGKKEESGLCVIS